MLLAEAAVVKRNGGERIVKSPRLDRIREGAFSVHLLMEQKARMES